MVDYSMQPDPLNAFSQGYGMVKGLRQDRAMQTAGAAMAGGDGKGARAALYGAGMIDQGNALQDREAKDAKDKLSFVKDIAIGLGRIPDADGRQTERRKALSQFRQTFQAMGLPDEAVARMEAGDLSDQALGLVAGEIDKQLQAVSLGNGGFGVFNNRTGDFDVRREPRIEQDYLVVPEGGKLVPKPLAGAGTVDPFAGQPNAFSAPAGSSPAVPENALAALTGMGARVTSGVRSPEDNKRVGGVADSYHLASRGGVARDLVPPAGMAMDQFEREVKSRLPAGWEAINEGDHIHIEPGPGASGAPTRVAQSGDPPGTIYGAPKARNEWTTLSAEDAKQYGPGQYQRNASTGEVKQVSGTAPKGSGGRLPAAALNLQNEHLGAIQTASAITMRLEQIARQLEGGQLNLGPVQNALSGAANFVGRSDPQTRNYASFRANLEKLRNDSLRLNKGVQTEGDATRAWNELMANLNDEGVVRQRLSEIEGYNRQALAFHEDSVTQLREDAGLPPIDTSRFRARPASPPPAPGGGTRSPSPNGQGGQNNAAALQQAREAIRKGAPRDAVIKRLRDHGINPAGI